MHRNRVAAMLAIGAVAGALVTGGCVSAATKPLAAAATAGARAAAATGGTANITIYGVNTDGAYWHAIVSGMIGDYGPAVSIGPNGQVDPAHNSEMSLWLTHRSLAPRRRAAVWLEPPTGCELEVLRLLAAARSNQRIAHDLVV